MKIKFLGAAGGQVTGSGYQLTSNSGNHLLIDLGLFQGPSSVEALNFLPLGIDVSHLSGVILTHAHLDHCGRLPLLENLNLRGDIYLTPPTADLAELALLDAAKVSREDHPDQVLYTPDDVARQVARYRVHDYGRPFNVNGFEVTFRDAGHIMGSSSVEVLVDNRKVIFSGDLGNTPEDLTRPTEMIKSGELVVMESTYGDRSHPSGDALEMIQAEINAVEQSGGVLLIPAFSLERTQELLHIISHLKTQSLISLQTPVFLDSPMAEKATAIYEKYKFLLNDEIAADYRTSDPFSFAGLHMVSSFEESQSIDELAGAKVIIAGSGMMTGGRVLGHAKKLLLLGNTRLLIVGYQGEGTLGREILSGKKEVEIAGQKIHINATVSEIQVMSSHADQPRLINWLKNIDGVSRVFLIHGEDSARAALAAKIKTDLDISNITLPTLGQEIEV